MSDLAKKYGVAPFELFCAYHLGITADGGYRFQNVHDVAKRFGCSSGVIKQILGELGMDSDSIVQSKFDMASAQVDVMAAPAGVSRTEMAKAMYEEYRKAPRRARDWKTELAEDARENERVFGQRKGQGNGQSSRG